MSQTPSAPGGAAAASLPEPVGGPQPKAVLLRRYLDYYRETALARLLSLPEDDRRAVVVTSGWSALELVWHLAHMERRWIVWGFQGEPVRDPWGDSGGDPDGAWRVPEGTGSAAVVAMLREGGRRTSQTLAAHDLDETAPPGPRFPEGPASLDRICFHLLHEYARHLGHLDVVVEILGGGTGE